MAALLWSACQISERMGNYKPESRGIEIDTRSCGKTSYRLVIRGQEYSPFHTNVWT